MPRAFIATEAQTGTDGDLFRPFGAPPMGLTGPSSPENVHWTFSRAFGPPKGEGYVAPTRAHMARGMISHKPSPCVRGTGLPRHTVPRSIRRIDRRQFGLWPNQLCLWQSCLCSSQ